MHGKFSSRVVEAVPPLLSQVRLRPPDATTTELLLEYEVLETAGQMYYALSEAAATLAGGKVMGGNGRINKTHEILQTGYRSISGMPFHTR